MVPAAFLMAAAANCVAVAAKFMAVGANCMAVNVHFMAVAANCMAVATYLTIFTHNHVTHEGSCQFV